ncbi:predicted protein [Nematostella vectensis]|uniref:G-protein coupled receptors family 1 profile domain-containing protein n=1 Tax=Nematostella vectensis TaxID=45351 RepID=A7RKS1_NEMVE|nr:QRFP-like peptide receptor [Nematostella vectensis]EDO48038.1 predicted protein [Nematostella vectensis]|eukprot:XP_001640101.1 predicted protein [Nematostella vectensis]
MLSPGQIVLKVAFSVVILFGTLGNLLVCLVVMLNKSTRTSMNYLLVNLAISDMILLVFFSPSFVFRDAFTHPSGEAGDLLCVFITGETFAWVAGYASAAFLIAIAIERYYATTRPHSYGSSLIKRRLKVVVVGCWVWALVWNCSGFKTKFYNEKFDSCDMAWETEYSFRIYAAMSFFAVGIFPSLTMILLYSKVVYSIWFDQNVTQIVRNAERHRKQRKRATKLALSVSALYAVCWLPELTIFVLSAFAPEMVAGNIAYPASVAMVSLNSAANPLIYGLSSNRIGREMARLICFWKRSVGDKGASTEHELDRTGVNKRGGRNKVSTVDENIDL